MIMPIVDSFGLQARTTQFENFVSLVAY